MNQRINFHSLSAMVAERLNADAADTERELQNYFTQVSDILLARGQASIPGVGTLNIVDGELIFTPDKALAEAINAPFAMFEPVELNSDVTEDELNGASNPEPEVIIEPEPIAEIEQKTEPETEQKTEPIIEPTTEIEQKTDQITETEQIIEPIIEQEPIIVTEPEPIIEPEPETTDEEPLEAEEIEETVADNRWLMFVIGLIAGIAIGAVACFMYMSWQWDNALKSATDPDSIEITE